MENSVAILLQWTIVISLIVPEHCSSISSPFKHLKDALWGGTNKDPESNINKRPPGFFHSFSPFSATEDIIKQYGYGSETHQIISDGGYIVTIHRILQPNMESRKTGYKLPIVFLHGFTVDANFFLSGSYRNAGFFFADAGYDVWLVNNRGTRRSRNHTDLNPNEDKAFWDFSFHEMGVNDMPIVTDLVLSKSNASQLYLLAHSMGAAIASIFLAENPSYNDKVNAMFLLSPSINMTHCRFPLAQSSDSRVNKLLQLFDEKEIMLPDVNVPIVTGNQCNTSIGFILCYLAADIFGMPKTNDSGISVHLPLSKYAPGVSIKTIRHFKQIIGTGKFSQYDYGDKGNLLRYGQKQPPDYDLSCIQAPTYVFYSAEDIIVNATDLLEGIQQYGNVVAVIHVGRPNGRPQFTHADYAFAKDAEVLVYDPILEAITKLETPRPTGLQQTTTGDKLPGYSKTSEYTTEKNDDESEAVSHVTSEYTRRPTVIQNDDGDVSEPVLQYEEVNYNYVTVDHTFITMFLLVLLLLTVINTTGLAFPLLHRARH